VILNRLKTDGAGENKRGTLEKGARYSTEGSVEA